MERRIKSAARLMIVAVVTGVLNIDEAADLMVRLIIPSEVKTKESVKFWVPPRLPLAPLHVIPGLN